MELEGRVVSILALEGGTSAKGSWKKQSVIIETLTDYPKKVCITVWGDKTASLNSLHAGDIVSMSVELESREFNGKWYTDVRAYRIEGRQESVNNIDTPPMPSQDDFDALYSSEEDMVF